MKQNQQSDKQLFDRHVKKIKADKRHTRYMQLLLFLSFFILWELSSQFHWIDPLIFSSPSRIVSLLYENILNGNLWYHMRVTVLETIAGFFIGTIGGIIIAFLLWNSRKLYDVLDPYLVVLNALPKVALGPIIIVALGPGYFSIIMMGAIISIIVTSLVVYSAFREVDKNYITVLQSFGATKWQCFKEAVFPASLPSIISTFKVNVGLSWVGVIVGEFLVAAKGLGYLIVYGFQVFNFTLVLYSLLVIAFIAAIMYQGVNKFEAWLIRKI
ncbi:ABC transporter permease [Paraliobacillus salinarum]|uniref:ABC transporter permease n=1 Tax=Paraliobacillus salinarum TaxID=1158996 RepID=UPI001FE426B0|nr:ABC transporter permease [Paraliobacillus salinarum]